MSAAVALGLVELYLGEVDSLKGKRHALKGLKEKVKHRFNVSVAEVDHEDLWQRATLGFAAVGPTACLGVACPGTVGFSVMGLAGALATGLCGWDLAAGVGLTRPAGLAATLARGRVGGLARAAAFFVPGLFAGALLADNLLANNATDSATITINPSAVIGDLVWSDKNSDGSSTGEPGIAGVTVLLRNSADTLTLQGA